MKIYAISDNIDTRTGLRLVGIDGALCHTKDELKSALEAVMANKEVGVLLITEHLCRDFPDMIKEIKLTRRLPLVVEIPDRHGSGRTKDFISAYISEAIGVKLT